MPTVKLFRFLRALMGVLALVCAAAPVRADLITGVWDPFFGLPFNNLGYRGQVVFNVPGACFDGPDGRVFNNNPCSNGAMSTAQLTVEFYDAGNEVQPTLETLPFDPLTLPVSYVDIVDGGVIGVGASYAPWVDSSLMFENASSYDFSIFFSGPPLLEPEVLMLGGPPTTATVRLVWKPSGSAITVEEAVAAGQVSNAAEVIFSRQVTGNPVPEPAGLLLAATALAAAATATRRRSRRS